MNEELLIRFLMGTCTEEELASIEKWVATDPAHAEKLFGMEKVWGLKNELHFSDKREIELAYNRFAHKIRPEKKIRKISYGWVKYAAAIVIILLSVNLYFMLSERDATKIAAYNTIEVPVGQRASLTLSDGTRVWLNAGSSLRYPSEFDRDTRRVELQGEGFFEVAPDQANPFIVHTPLLNIKVLGTQFNVKAYGNAVATVALAEGKVQVSTVDQQNMMTLRPNEQVSYSGSTGLVIDKDINVEALRQWTVGELLFSDERLEEIAQTLERHFGVSIHISPSELSNERFTCRTQPNATIEQVLRLLHQTKRLDYTIDHQTIYITKIKK